MKKFLVIIFLFTAAIGFGQTAERPDIEIVESVPVETVLGSPDIRNAHDVWIEMINSATTSLDAEEFYISNVKDEPLDDIIKAILEAGKRGVAVRIIADSKMYKTYPETVDLLGQKKNISTRVIDFGKLAGGGIQHSKYFIVDGKEIFLGSQNFDWRSLKHIHEVGLRIHQQDVVSYYHDIFELDWQLAEWNDAKRIPSLLKYTTYKFPSWVMTAQHDTAWLYPTASPKGLLPDSTRWDEPNIIDLIDNARHDVMLQFLTYTTHSRDKSDYVVLDNAIRRAAARGVKIKMIASDWEKGSPYDESLKKLAAFPNIEVKFSAIPQSSEGYIPFSRVEHCKYICVDGSSFWLGTSNAEKSYFYNTRNLGIIVENMNLATTMRNIFMKSWNGPYVETIKPDGVYTPRAHGENK